MAIPWGTSQTPGSKFVTLNHSHHWRSSSLCSRWKRHGFAFPALVFLLKSPSVGLQNAILIYTVFHTTLLMTKKKDKKQFYSKWSATLVSVSCTSLVSLCSPHPETAGLIKLWNGLWKTQLWHQLVTVLYGAEIMSSRMQEMLWISYKYVVIFFLYSEFRSLGTIGQIWKQLLSH